MTLTTPAPADTVVGRVPQPGPAVESAPLGVSDRVLVALPEPAAPLVELQVVARLRAVGAELGPGPAVRARAKQRLLAALAATA